MKKTFNYSYNILPIADNQAFMNACQQIEGLGFTLSKERLLIDVDGTLIQIYTQGEREIRVYNDYEVDAVFVDSDLDLSAAFGPTICI